jgi:hypothetical protein
MDATNHPNEWREQSRQIAADAVAAIRTTHPDWPGDDVRAAVTAILRASAPATLDGAA